MNKLGLPENNICPKISYGLYNWPHNRLLGGRGSKRPAAHTQQKLPLVPPVPAASNVTWHCSFPITFLLLLLLLFCLVVIVQSINQSIIYLPTLSSRSTSALSKYERAGIVVLIT